MTGPDPEFDRHEKLISDAMQRLMTCAELCHVRPGGIDHHKLCAYSRMLETERVIRNERT